MSEREVKASGGRVRIVMPDPDGLPLGRAVGQDIKVILVRPTGEEIDLGREFLLCGVTWGVDGPTGFARGTLTFEGVDFATRAPPGAVAAVEVEAPKRPLGGAGDADCA